MQCAYYPESPTGKGLSVSNNVKFLPVQQVMTILRDEYGAYPHTQYRIPVTPATQAHATSTSSTLE